MKKIHLTQEQLREYLGYALDNLEDRYDFEINESYDRDFEYEKDLKKQIKQLWKVLGIRYKKFDETTGDIIYTKSINCPNAFQVWATDKTDSDGFEIPYDFGADALFPSQPTLKKYYLIEAFGDAKPALCFNNGQSFLPLHQKYYKEFELYDDLDNIGVKSCQTKK